VDLHTLAKVLIEQISWNSRQCLGLCTVHKQSMNNTCVNGYSHIKAFGDFCDRHAPDYVLSAMGLFQNVHSIKFFCFMIDGEPLQSVSLRQGFMWGCMRISGVIFPDFWMFCVTLRIFKIAKK